MGKRAEIKDAVRGAEFEIVTQIGDLNSIAGSFVATLERQLLVIYFVVL